MTSTSAPVTFHALCIDTPDAGRAARFYADLTGGAVTGEYPEYGYAQAEAPGVTLNFQTVAGYARPQWPGQEHPSSSTSTSGCPTWSPPSPVPRGSARRSPPSSPRTPPGG